MQVQALRIWALLGWTGEQGAGTGRKALGLAQQCHLCVERPNVLGLTVLRNEGYNIDCLRFKNTTLNDINKRNIVLGGCPRLAPWGPEDIPELAGSSLWSSPSTSPSFLLLKRASPILGSAQLQFLRGP